MKDLAAALTCLVLAACLSSPAPADRDGVVAPAADASIDASVADATPADATPADASPFDADPCADLDGDGYLPAGCGGAAPDCMEGVASVHPGALDLPDNAIDDDCWGGAQGDNGKLEGNGISDDAQGTYVSNGALSLSFLTSFGESIAQLSVPGSSTNLLYDGPAAEQIVGVHWWATHFARTALTPAVSGEVMTRAIYRRRIAWTAEPSGQLSGIRWVTVHPDGRVHIDHQVNLEASPAGAFLTSYVSLVPSEFTHVHWSASGDAVQALSIYDHGTHGDYLAHFGATTTESHYSCAYHNTSELLVGWGWDVDDAPAAAGPRVTQGMLGGNPDNHSFALQFDWRRAGDGAVASPLTYRGNFLLYLGTTDTNPCQPMAIRHAETTRPALLNMTMGSLITTSVGDDDGDGYDQGGGFYSMRATSGEIEFSVDTQTGSLVAPRSSTYFIEALGELDPVVYHQQTQLGHGADYHLHRVAGGNAWLHLGVPLADGDVIRIDSP